MTLRVSLSAILIALASVLAAAPSAATADLFPPDALERLGVQEYWHVRLPLAGKEELTRIVLLDDNLYALSETNKVFAIHSLTGIIRWSTPVAEEGLTIRGPSHNAEYVFFTTSGAARVLNRRTGELATEPRTLRGAVIDVAHDTATVTVGRVHGVRNGDVFGVYRPSGEGEPKKDALAQLRITSIDTNRSKGRLFDYDKRNRPRSGDRVRANVELPLEKVKLPFAASSAAVADKTRIYVGAANQRFYSLGILNGFRHWQLMTPRTVSATPVLQGEDLIFAGQDGRVICCTKHTEGSRFVPEGNWIFQTDGPVFADPVVLRRHVLVASSDRSLYCLDRATGRRIWRERFDTPLTEAPIVSDGRVFQQVPQHGLFVLDARTGRHLWSRPEAGRFLTQLDGDVYLLAMAGSGRVLRLDAETGREKARVDAAAVALGAGSMENQCILLATRTGELACLRSKNAPRLDPSRLTEVLRNDRNARIQKELDEKRKAELQEKRLAKADTGKRRKLSLFEEDWLRSSRTGRPLGGRGLIEVEERGDEEEDEELDEGDDDLDEEDEEDDEFDDEDEEDEDDEDDWDDEDEDDGDDEDEGEDDEDEDDGDDEDEDDEDDEGDEEDDEDEDEDDDDDDDDD